MAFINGGMNFTGSIGDFCAYRLPGSEKIVVRRKSGPDRKRIRQDKAYAITRLYNDEWKACTAATGSLIRSMFPIKHLSDYPYAGTLNGLFRFIQNEDLASPLGKRGVLISQHGQRLEGFSLNRKHNFESYIKHPLQCSIDKANAAATVQVPELVPGISINNPDGYPLYRLVAVLGAVPDIVYNEEKKMYVPMADETVFPVVAYTDWHTAKQKMEAGTLSPSLPNAAAVLNHTLLLAVGIEFGIPLSEYRSASGEAIRGGKVVEDGVRG